MAPSQDRHSQPIRSSSIGVLNRMAQLNYFARRDAQRAEQTSVLAAAITIVPPNPGDRFSLTISGAANGDFGAGSLTASYRATDSLLVFGGLAQGQSQTRVKGGASFSFR